MNGTESHGCRRIEHVLTCYATAKLFVSNISLSPELYAGLQVIVCVCVCVRCVCVCVFCPFFLLLCVCVFVRVSACFCPMLNFFIWLKMSSALTGTGEV